MAITIFIEPGAEVTHTVQMYAVLMKSTTKRKSKINLYRKFANISVFIIKKLVVFIFV